MVQHRPLIRLIPRNKHCLPVKIAGVNVHGNGIGWLQTIVSGNDVAFVPILKSKEYVVCEVTLPQMLNVSFFMFLTFLFIRSSYLFFPNI